MNIKSLFLNLLFIIGISAIFIEFVSNKFVFSNLATIIGIMFLIMAIIFNKKKRNIVIFLLFILLIFVLIKILSLQYSYDALFYYYLMTCSNIGYSLFLINKKSVLYSVCIIYFFLTIFLLYWTTYLGDFSLITSSSSENIVNLIYLTYSVLLIAIYYREKNRIIVFPASFSLIISFLSLGRMGIITSFLLLVGVILVKYNRKWNIPQKLFGTILVISAVVFNLDIIMSFLKGVLTRFGHRNTIIADSPRLNIWKEYLESMSIQKFFFGSGEELESYYGFVNVHNSFIQFHDIMGIIGILFLLIILYLFIRSLINKNYLYTILFSVILLRGMTDITYLPGHHDFIIFYLMFEMNNYNSRIDKGG